MRNKRKKKPTGQEYWPTPCDNRADGKHFAPPDGSDPADVVLLLPWDDGDKCWMGKCPDCKKFHVVRPVVNNEDAKNG